MATDIVVGESRCAALGVTNFAVGNEAGFDESLEAVTDSEDESIAVLEEVHDGIGDAWAAENGGNKFAGSCGFVSGAKAAGEDKDL